MVTTELRAATVTDVPSMLEMLRASAVDQGYPAGEVVVTEEDLRIDGFGPAPRFRAWMAEVAGSRAGMALYFITYSTWGSRLVLYLEDLYVKPEYRSHGVARALLDRLAVTARNEGCGRFQWLVHRENVRAIRLYEAFGADAAEDWVLMSVRGTALDKKA